MKGTKRNLTQKRLKEVLNYDTETGVFTNKISRGSTAHAGTVSGYKHEGYIRIAIDSTQYRAHRLAWLYVYGYMPEHGIDHKDRVKHHNWVDNLREASQQCNLRNCGNRKDNTSGVKGVYWTKHKNKWSAQITVNKKICYLGSYKDYNNAVCARLAGEQSYNWSNCDSSSPAYKYVKTHIQNRR